MSLDEDSVDSFMQEGMDVKSISLCLLSICVSPSLLLAVCLAFRKKGGLARISQVEGSITIVEPPVLRLFPRSCHLPAAAVLTQTPQTVCREIPTTLRNIHGISIELSVIFFV